MIAKLAQFTDVRVALVVGGLSLAVQATTLRSNPEIVVATPVRSCNPMLPSPCRTLHTILLQPNWYRLWVRSRYPLKSIDCSGRSEPLSHASGVSPLVCDLISGARRHLPHGYWRG